MLRQRLILFANRMESLTPQTLRPYQKHLIHVFLCCSDKKAPFISPVKFIAAYLIHHPNQQFFFIAKGDTHTIRSIIMDKIGGSVQRIYQPAIVFRSQAARTFFGNESCFREAIPEVGPQYGVPIPYLHTTHSREHFSSLPCHGQTATLITKKSTRPECYFTYIQRYLL